jgi:YgiT-type zinc finger domain-containing protein
MDCTCGGLLEEGKSCYRSSGEHYCVILEDIPAFQCTRCGKIFLSEETSAKIERLVSRIKKDSDEVVTGRPSVNLYDYR